MLVAPLLWKLEICFFVLRLIGPRTKFKMLVLTFLDFLTFETVSGHEKQCLYQCFSVKKSLKMLSKRCFCGSLHETNIFFTSYSSGIFCLSGVSWVKSTSPDSLAQRTRQNIGKPLIYSTI